MASQTFYGLNINWGLGATDYSIAGVTGLYQSSDHELKQDEVEIRDQRGNVVAWCGYNPSEAATFEYVCKDANAASGSAAITYPANAGKISVVADSGNPVSGSGWIVQNVTIKKINTDACKVTFKAIRYPAIT